MTSTSPTRGRAAGDSAGHALSAGVGSAGNGALDAAWVEHVAQAVVASPRGETAVTYAPATGRELARLPRSTAEDVAVAYDGARDVQRSWAQLPVSSRAAILLRFHDLVLDHLEDLLDLVQLETGKTRLNALEEVVHVASVARYYARTSERTLRSRRLVGFVPGLTQVTQVNHPKGVVGIVSPWNYPLSMGITDALPALVAGNAVVLRPDPQTPLTALAAVDLLHRAGLPPRVLQVVLGDGPDVGAAVLDAADHVCFTGSTATGRTVAVRAAERLVGASLELGGKNPMYVAADADVPRAVEGALRACFSSAGQLCVSVERLLLHETIADEFLAAFVPAVEGLRLGAGLHWDADMGSLVSKAQLDRVSAYVDDAVAAGARVLTGGTARPDVGPWFYAPTVLSDVGPSARLHREEVFGPVVAVSRVRSDAEAIAAANDTDFGLHASVWTRDHARGVAIASLLRAGSVDVDEGYAASFASAAAPMGGMKASGLGRRQGVEGLLRFTEPQTIAVQRLAGLGVPDGVAPQTFARVATGALRVMGRLGRA
ncbi:succinic semialdehyde dehydrogenase [Agilicoccus flavus]|uniref:succinic semialdehyde dehydrogenase n=1 Tax=Agilicoccus flavus TaxID=2775968 RepID=UPI001CF6F20B|nr:succinic semialdehyde dehydrogenase [Agilicoccus flavus]